MLAVLMSDAIMQLAKGCMRVIIIKTLDHEGDDTISTKFIKETKPCICQTWGELL